METEEHLLFLVGLKVKQILKIISSLFTSGNDNPDTSIWFNPDEALRTNTYNSGSIHDVITNRVFRDPSAWYHIVVAYDTTQSTASNRVKIYVNGVQETSLAHQVILTQNYETFINDASYTHRVGSHTSSRLCR